MSTAPSITVRYRGLARNGAHLHLLCCALNLRRAERLAA